MSCRRFATEQCIDLDHQTNSATFYSNLYQMSSTQFHSVPFPDCGYVAPWRICPLNLCVVAPWRTCPLSLCVVAPWRTCLFSLCVGMLSCAPHGISAQVLFSFVFSGDPLCVLGRMRAAKRSRLLSVAGVGKVSDRGLQEMLAAVRREPQLLEDNTSSDAIQRAFDSVANAVKAESILEMEDGTQFTWFHAEPAAILRYFLRECRDFERLFKARLAARPCTPDSPWKLVLHTDEVTPGNALRPDNRRKSWLWYFSFVDLGAELLCREECWLPFGILRSHIVKDVRGGLSATFTSVLQAFLPGPKALTALAS
jgi:hypothetical protein